MISTIVTPLSAQMFRFASQLACVSRCLPQQVFSLLWLLERQELAHDSTCPIVIRTEPEVADLGFQFPFLCGLGTGVLVALALAVTLRYFCSFRVELGNPGIGGDSRLILERLGNVAGLYDVTVQSECPRSVVTRRARAWTAVTSHGGRISESYLLKFRSRVRLFRW